MLSYIEISGNYSVMLFFKKNYLQISILNIEWLIKCHVMRCTDLAWRRKLIWLKRARLLEVPGYQLMLYMLGFYNAYIFIVLSILMHGKQVHVFGWVKQMVPWVWDSYFSFFFRLICQLGNNIELKRYVHLPPLCSWNDAFL